MKKINTVGIIGLGALGIMYAKHFTEQMGKDSVRIVADKNRIAKYRNEGIYCNGQKCDFQYVSDEDVCEPVDLLLFTVKNNDLHEAIKIANNQVGENTIILSLLNGITSEEIIGKTYGSEKLLYSVAQGMDASKIGNRLTFVNLGFLSIGEENNQLNDNLQSVAAFFDQTNTPYEIPKNIKHKLWSKLMLNTGVNTTVAIFETNYGGIQVSGTPRDTVISAMKEVIIIACKEGIALQEQEIDYWLQIIDSLNPNGMPSMRQDTMSRRNTEIDLFSGTIITLGRKHGIPTPVNDFLFDRIKKLEANY